MSLIKHWTSAEGFIRLRLLRCFAAASAVAVLVACGGGGGGTPEAAVSAPTPPLVPSITSVTPTSVVTGGQLTLSGQQLDRIARVTLNGTTLPSVGVNSSTSLRVSVPAGATSGQLSVVDASGAVQVLPQVVTVLAPVVFDAFSPASALTGGRVVVTGRALDRVSAVQFSGTTTVASITARSSAALTVTVPSGASNGPITLLFGSGESLNSSANFTVIPRIVVNAASVYRVAAAGEPVTVIGLGLNEVNTVTVGGAPVPIDSRGPTQIVFSAPAGLACAPVVLTSLSQPNVAAGNLVVGAGCTNPVQISGLEFAQVQSQAANDPYQRLNPGQETWVRAYVNATTANRAAPVVRLTGFNATQVLGTLDMVGPATLPQLAEGQTPPDSQRYNLGQTFRVQLPSAWVDAGLRVRVEVDPDNLVGARTSQEASPSMGSATRLTVVIVPLVSGSNTPTLPTQATVLNELAKVLPLARDQITVQFRAPYPLTSVTDGVDTSAEWGSALSELDQLRRREAPTTLYYGLVRPMVGAGTAGIGYVNSPTSRSPSLSSLGWDASRSSWIRIMVHELGHNFSRGHTACGTTPTDATYPYANGAMPPVPLFDSNADSIVAPGTGATASDVMGYCNGAWFSDYNYRAVQGFLEAQRGMGNVGRFTSAAAAQPLLVVNGSISEGSARIDRVAPGRGALPPVEDSPYELVVTTTEGVTVRVRVAATEVDHAETPTQHFTGVIPHPGSIARIAVLRDGRTLGERSAAPARAQAAGAPAPDTTPWAQRRVDGTRTSFTWNAARYPLATIEHVQPDGQRSVLALQAQGGQTTLETAHLPAGGVFEIGLSDGLNVATLTLQR